MSDITEAYRAAMPLPTKWTADGLDCFTDGGEWVQVVSGSNGDDKGTLRLIQISTDSFEYTEADQNKQAEALAQLIALLLNELNELPVVFESRA